MYFPCAIVKLEIRCSYMFNCISLIFLHFKYVFLFLFLFDTHAIIYFLFFPYYLISVLALLQQPNVNKGLSHIMLT